MQDVLHVTVAVILMILAVILVWLILRRIRGWMEKSVQGTPRHGERGCGHGGASGAV